MKMFVFSEKEKGDEKMKLISFKVEGIEKFGLVENGHVIDLSKRTNISTLREYISLNSDLVKSVTPFKGQIADYTFEEVELLPVITNPSKILCAGVNYDEHRKEANKSVTEYPTIFLRLAESQIAANEAMIIPKESSDLDYEGEIAIVISKDGFRISEEDAFDYIAGYSAYNDGSIRDWQLHTTQWIPGKNFNGTGAFGPWLVLKDEIADHEVLTVETRLNGEVMQKADTTMLLFSMPQLISYASSFTTLKAGDVIVTGTPGGVGFKRNPPVYMVEGDIVEIEVSKVGILRNKIQTEKTAEIVNSSI